MTESHEGLKARHRTSSFEPSTPTAACSKAVELSAVIMPPYTGETLGGLVRRLHEILANDLDSYEIIVVQGASFLRTKRLARAQRLHLVEPEGPRYGDALQASLQSARGEYILIWEGALQANPAVIKSMLQARHSAELIIASRHFDRRAATADRVRRALSKALNTSLAWLLNLNVTDVSGGCRLMRSRVVKQMPIRNRGDAALVEMVVRAYADGWRVAEVPFSYSERLHDQLVRSAFEFARTAYDMWRLRNSIACADYDARAYDSRIPLQRMWQRRRCEVLARLAAGGTRTLDIGCGSSRTLAGWGDSGIGLDVLTNKLRYARRYALPLTNADILQLPFRSGSFDRVVCSQVIEHLAPGRQPFDEMVRLLAPGGRLVLGTPDYGTRTWPIIELLYGLVAPGAYADQHITRYTHASLVELLQGYGLVIHEVEYVFGSEMILMASKPQSPAPHAP